MMTNKVGVSAWKKVSLINGSSSNQESGCGGGLCTEFIPDGLQVLVVDDDPLCLQDLEKMLRDCLYEVTTCSSPKTALSMLRNEKNKFDIVLSGVHMTDMDGLKLLEMDLPVIMMSSDDNHNVAMKCVEQGACHYLTKPIGKKDIQYIWQHLVRKRRNQLKEFEHSAGNVDESERHRKSSEDAGYSSSGNDGNGTISSKRKKEGEDETDRDKDDTSRPKKPRVVWSDELHEQFVKAVNQLGIDKAVPKKIMELMNNPMITRENVASHLQKYRLHYKKNMQHQSRLNTPFIEQESAKFGSISPIDGRLDFQDLVFPAQLPLHGLVVQSRRLGSSVNTGTGVPHNDQSNIFSSETSRLRFGLGQQQLTNTNNHVNLFHGYPTSTSLQVNEGASGYRNFTTRTGSTCHAENFEHENSDYRNFTTRTGSTCHVKNFEHGNSGYQNFTTRTGSTCHAKNFEHGNHNSSVRLHMTQSQLSRHSVNGLPSSIGQQMFSNDIAGQVLVRNETVVNVRGASYSPLTQPSSMVDRPMNCITGFPINNLALDSTANAPILISNGFLQDDESLDIFDETNPHSLLDWELENMALNINTSQSNFSIAHSSASCHQSFDTSQKNEQKENVEHGNPDNNLLVEHLARMRT